MNTRWLAAAACLAALSACHGPAENEHRAEPAIPGALAAQIPADAIALGGFDAARVRALGLQDLPGDGGVFAVSRAHVLTQLDPKLQTAGPARRTELIDRAQAIAGGSVLWAVGRGSAIPTLPGNAENIGVLLRTAQWVSITIRDGEAGKLRLEVVANCANGEVASLVEQTARASFALAASAERRKPELAAMLKAVRVERENATARVQLETTAEDLAAIIGALR